ncbi:MAG: hypothetical protein ABEK59_11980, partial [Halobacteria archaeon]
ALLKGTTIASVERDRITLSEPALETVNTRLLIAGTQVLENCSLTKNEKTVTLNPQSGFIAPNQLKEALVNEFSGVIAEPGPAPNRFTLFFAPATPQYLNAVRFLLEPSQTPAKATAQLKRVNETENKTLWQGPIEEGLNDAVRFTIQEASDNTLFDGNDRLVLELTSLQNLVSLSYFLKFYKVAL